MRIGAAIMLLAAAAALPAQVCRINAAGLNRERSVLGDVNTECPGGPHTAPFGNWGVTSNFGLARDSRQFEGWCRDVQVCDNNGACRIECRDRWFEWNSCTADPLFRAPNCTLYNDAGCTAQKTATSVNVHGTRDVDVPVSCPVAGEGGCRDVRVFTNGTNFMSLYELDPFTGNQLVQTLYFPPSPVFLNCLTMECPATGSEWVRPNGYDSPPSPIRVTAEMATVVNSGTFLDPNGVCRNVNITLRTSSAASYEGQQVAPSSIASTFGPSLATGTSVAASLPLPTELGGVSIRLRDSAGASALVSLIAVTPQQINFLLPENVAAGQATLSLSSAGQVRATGVIQVERPAPGLFSANANGQGVAAAVAVREGVNGAQTNPPVFTCPGGAGTCSPVPLDVRSPTYLLLFGTGIRGASRVTVSVGGIDVPVEYAGPQPAFPGLDQVNLRLPAALAGRGLVNIELQAAGRPANVVTVQIQ